MLYGLIKPTVIKIFRSRFRYRRWKLPKDKPLRVVAYDMKYILVTDPRVLRIYRVPWKDIQLVTSEQVVQVPVVNITDNSRTVNRQKEKKPFFKAGVKPKDS